MERNAMKYSQAQYQRESKNQQLKQANSQVSEHFANAPLTKSICKGKIEQTQKTCETKCY